MRIVTLLNQHMQAEKGSEQGPTGVAEVWTLIFSDKVTGDQVRVSFPREARDEIVRQLTGGIVLAGGELPRLKT